MCSKSHQGQIFLLEIEIAQSDKHKAQHIVHSLLLVRWAKILPITSPSKIATQKKLFYTLLFQIAFPNDQFLIQFLALSITLTQIKLDFSLLLIL